LDTTSERHTRAQAQVAGSFAQEGRMKSIVTLLWLAGLLIVPPAEAQEQEINATKLEGTLAKIDRAGSITLGYREASFPLPYLTTAGPTGHPVHLCLPVLY